MVEGGVLKVGGVVLETGIRLLTMPPPVEEMLGVISGSSLGSAGVVAQLTLLSGAPVEARDWPVTLLLGLVTASTAVAAAAVVDITGAEMAAVVRVCPAVGLVSLAWMETVW